MCHSFCPQKGCASRSGGVPLGQGGVHRPPPDTHSPGHKSQIYLCSMNVDNLFYSSYPLWLAVLLHGNKPRNYGQLPEFGTEFSCWQKPSTLPESGLFCDDAHIFIAVAMSQLLQLQIASGRIWGLEKVMFSQASVCSWGVGWGR